MISIALDRVLGDLHLKVDIEVPNSGLTVFFGPSGSGKTSVVNMLAGLMAPDKGLIKVHDRVLYSSEARISLPPHARRIGYIFQESRLFPHLTVAGNLRYGYRAGHQITLDEVIELLGIGHLLRRRPHHLSGGEKQRVAIGRALLTNPDLLLMDEPLSALDELRKEEIIPFIKRVRDEFYTPIVYVTHSTTEVERLANNVVMMKTGAVAAFGSMEEVLPLLRNGSLKQAV